IWSIDWIVFWGVVIYNVLVETGAFAQFRQWLVTQATADVRIQAILMAWALGALLEGLVGFGYPWAVIAPILVGLGVREIDAIRVAAIGNNAPVSYGALGAPIIALAAVTNVPLLSLSASVGRIVAILALLPPWILIYLVTGRRGLRGVWPLPVVGSLAYVLGQFPTSQFLGPYLPDVIGSLVCFGALLLLLRYWRPAETLGLGGVPIAAEPAPVGSGPPAPVPAGARPGEPVPAGGGFAPAIAGTWILVSLLVILAVLRVGAGQFGAALKRSFSQMWGALLVAPIVFGLATVFNYSGMASTLAFGFSRVGTWFILLAPLL